MASQSTVRCGERRSAGSVRAIDWASLDARQHGGVAPAGHRSIRPYRRIDARRRVANGAGVRADHRRRPCPHRRADRRGYGRHRPRCRANLGVHLAAFAASPFRSLVVAAERVAAIKRAGRGRRDLARFFCSPCLWQRSPSPCRCGRTCLRPSRPPRWCASRCSH